MPTRSPESRLPASLSVAKLLRALGDFRRTWPQLALCHLLTSSIMIVIVGPIVGGLLLLFLAREQDGVLTDTEIATYLLDPVAMVLALIIGALWVGVAFARTSLLLVIGFGAVDDRRVTYMDAVRYVAVRGGRFGRLAGRILVRLMLVAAPFLAAVLGLYPLFLADHDINYYLTDRPAEYWRAIGLACLILAVGAGFVLRLFAGWILALPVLLFEGVDHRQALARSWELTAGWRGRIVLLLAGWFLSAALLSTFASFVVGRVGGILVPHLENTTLVLVGIGATLLFAGVANVMVQFFTGSLGPLIVVRLYRAIAGPGSLTPSISEAGSLAGRPTFDVPGRSYIAIAAIAPIAVLLTIFAGVRGIGADHEVEIIAHRGASAVCPENTMAAFEEAYLQAATFVELDVQEDAEGEVIVAHDSDFMKQAGVDLKVWNSTTLNRADLDIGSRFQPRRTEEEGGAMDFSDQRVPTLRQVLEWAKEKSEPSIGVVIELKYYGHDRDLERRVAEIVKESNVTGSIKIMSLKREGLRKMAEVEPEWPRGLLNTASIGDLTKLDVDFLALNAAAATSSQIRRAHKRGMKVFVWTLNDPAQIFIMLSRGADGVITDEPGLARDVLDFRSDLGPVGRVLFWFAGETGIISIDAGASAAGDA